MQNIYMIDRKNINVRNENWKKLDEIKNELGFRSFDNVIEFLVKIKDRVKLEKAYKCQNCGPISANIPGKLDPKKINLLHKDIENTVCKAAIVSDFRIKIEKSEINDNIGKQQIDLKKVREEIRKQELEEYKDELKNKVKSDFTQ